MRAVQGVGAAIMFAVSLALLAAAYPDMRQRAGALAAYGATIGAAFAVGPLVGGALTSGLDWRWIFLINLPIGLFCIAITRAYVQESRDPAARRIDWAGQDDADRRPVPARARAAARPRGRLEQRPRSSASSPARRRCSAPSWRWRRASPSRCSRCGLFRDRSFTGAQIAAFAISASFFAIFLYTTLYLQQILGLSAIEAGLVYLPGTITMLFVSGATSALGAKVSARAMVGGGLALVAVGMVLFTLADVDSSWAVILPGAVVALIGTGLFNPALTAVALGTVSSDRAAWPPASTTRSARRGSPSASRRSARSCPPRRRSAAARRRSTSTASTTRCYAGAALAAIGAVAAWCLISPRFGAAAPVPEAEGDDALAVAGAEPALAPA